MYSIQLYVHFGWMALAHSVVCKCTCMLPLTVCSSSWCQVPHKYLPHCTKIKVLVRCVYGTDKRPIKADNIGLVGVSAKWSYVTAPHSHHDQAIPILPPLLFMHVGHPYIPLFKIRRIFDLLVLSYCGPCDAENACNWRQSG